MNNNWKLKNYILDPDTNIWIKKNYNDIAYSDGQENEQYILDAVNSANDLSSLSDELSSYIRDWPSAYHLSKRRSNLLRPLTSIIKGNVLEIGAGCGAITRYLGESCNHVTALEGTKKRASIARSRTRDLNNIDIICDDFNKFSSPNKYDVVTLIGVLEYAALYNNKNDDPGQAMLQKAASFLKPGGKLIIAIENQLGLKYFAGAPEDHLGQTMYGIEDRYKSDSIKTYGKVEIEHKLKNAGFKQIQFMMPFPDYKLPTSVINEKAILDHDFDPTPFISNSVRADNQLPKINTFSTELTWPVITKNKLTLDLSNSFLIISSNNCSIKDQDQALAWHYSDSRKKKFCRQNIFARDKSSGKIYKTSSALVLKEIDKNSEDSQSLLSYKANSFDKYQSGSTLAYLFRCQLTAYDWCLEDIIPLFSQYFKWLLNESSLHNNKDNITKNSILHGYLFDAIPTNIIVDKNGNYHFIDREWVYNKPLTLGYMLYRSVTSLMREITRVNFNHKQNIYCIADLIINLGKSLDLNITNEDIDDYLTQDSFIYNFVYSDHISNFCEKTKEYLLSKSISFINFHDLNYQYNDIKIEHRNVKIKYNNIKDKYDDIKDKYDDIEDKYDDIKDKYNDIKDKYDDIEDKYDDIEDKYDDIKDKYSQTKNELNNLKNLTHQYKEKYQEVSALLEKKSWKNFFILRWSRRSIDILKTQGLKSLIYQILIKIWRILPLPIKVRYFIKKIIKRYLFKFINSSEYSNSLSLKNNYILEHHKNKDNNEETYINYKENKNIEPIIKTVAFYLPQFHCFPENDKWWGKGFTEWTNVKRARPFFKNHYQPRVPEDKNYLGYYNLIKDKDILKKQAIMAKNYGIYGFNFYYYWFDGKTLMEKPLENLLADSSIDLPFCLTWANENWTRRWDGLDKEVLISQNHSYEDSLNFIRNVMKYFHDPRYIKINNKPMLMVYRANLIPGIKKVIKIWKKEAIKNGFDGIYLGAVEGREIKSPKPFNFDFSVSFPPNTVLPRGENNAVMELENGFSGNIFSYKETVFTEVHKKPVKHKHNLSVMLCWDNSARTMQRANIFYAFTLSKFRQWLSNACHRTLNNKNLQPDERFVFINAWNEWAEGTYLEPDKKYGFGYLDSCYQVLKDFDKTQQRDVINLCDIKQNSQHAIILHIHYIEVWSEINKKIISSGMSELDLYVTCTSIEGVQAIKKLQPNARVFLVENRGRDILPFLYVLRRIINLNYISIFKLHGKRSLHRVDGDDWRKSLFNSLIGNKKIAHNHMKLFEKKSKLGMIAADSSITRFDSNNMFSNKDKFEFISKLMQPYKTKKTFVAGSMFIFRPEALKDLLILKDEDFELEVNALDGTLAHAVERYFMIAVENAGYYIKNT